MIVAKIFGRPYISQGITGLNGIGTVTKSRAVALDMEW